MSTPNNLTPRTPAQTILLVAGREFRTYALGKAYLITTAIMLILTVGGIIAGSFFLNREDTTEYPVTYLGEKPVWLDSAASLAQAQGAQLHTEGAPADADPTQLLQADNAPDLVVVAAAPAAEPEAFVHEKADAQLTALLDGALQRYKLAQTLEAAGLHADSALQEISAVSLPVTVVDDGKQANPANIILAIAGAIVLMMAVLSGGGTVAAGVTEEKQSRVVEILLATVKPLHLLAGKILGLGAATLLQVGLLAATALAAGSLTGVIAVGGQGGAIIGAVLLFTVLGFIFYATLFGATGALVSRVEDLQSAQMPIVMIAMVAIYVPIFGFESADATWMTVLSWIPPFSATVVPLLISLETISWWHVLGSALIMAATCVATTRIAAAIYQRSILYQGQRLTWRAALKREV